MHPTAEYPKVGYRCAPLGSDMERMCPKPTPSDKQASAVELAVTILKTESGLQVHRNELLSICIWKWTATHGKYRGCQYWTRSALEDGDYRNLAHEHVVPRRQLVLALEGLDDPSEVEVRTLLEAMAIACVVTRKEHEFLDEADWGELVANPWARYGVPGVEVIDTWAA